MSATKRVFTCVPLEKLREVPLAAAIALSCGVLVTDGQHLLLGHATGSARWDIPKGLADPGEAALDAARRELREETGLTGGELTPLGRFGYLPRKDLELFLLLVPAMPDLAGLRCTSVFSRGGRMMPEFDRFACPVWDAALPMVGKSMQRVLADIATERGWGGGRSVHV